MVKVYGPMFSIDASGSIGKVATFSKWKGRHYVRSHVVPANPKSPLQVSVRAMVRFLSQAWAGVGSTPQGSWEDRADAAQISPFNAFCGYNASRWREFQAPCQTDPAAETGTPPVLTLDSATGGPSYIDLTFTMTTVNDCWGIMIFRSPTGTFATSRANCVAVVPAPAPGAYIYTDSGLVAGTYYYDARAFTAEGLLDAEEGEVTGTAT